jgi:hypothetical protein
MTKNNLSGATLIALKADGTFEIYHNEELPSKINSPEHEVKAEPAIEKYAGLNEEHEAIIDRSDMTEMPYHKLPELHNVFIEGEDGPQIYTKQNGLVYVHEYDIVYFPGALQGWCRHALKTREDLSKKDLKLIDHILQA